MEKGCFFSVWSKADLVIGLFPYSPIPVTSLSASCSVGIADLVGLCPTPHKGAALDPAGGACTPCTPALAFAR